MGGGPHRICMAGLIPERRLVRDGAAGMGVVSWIVLGALVGLVVHARAPGRFPGGAAGTVAAGTAGGFLGGGIFTLAAQRATSRLDLTALGIAVVGAVLILAAARSAGYADPR
jgi:uncharacterized membrane protein YeaQ/YmgE (transglycosylase-associated protein family)